MLTPAKMAARGNFTRCEPRGAVQIHRSVASCHCEPDPDLTVTSFADRSRRPDQFDETGGAHLFHVFPTFASGGVAIRMCEMMNRLGPQFRHTVLALDGVLTSRSRLNADATVEFVELRFDKGRQVSNLLRFARVLKRLRPDLLLTYNWGAVEWGFVDRLIGVCPHIHFESGFGPEEADRQIRRRVLFRRIALARSAAVVVPSKTLLRLATETWRLDAGRMRYIPNGVDCDRYHCDPAPGAIPGFEKRPGETIVGTVAPLRAEKNLTRLIAGFAACATTPTRLLIVGDGPERARLVESAARLGVAERVVFAGHIDAPEQVLGWMDLFAISSDTEQMPNALIQAMAASRPVAGVDVGDVKEIVAPANRPFIVARGDAAGFSAALERLLDDAALRRELGQANRAHVVATYAMPLMVERYRELFESGLALAGARRAPEPRLSTKRTPGGVAASDAGFAR